jgi:hypothetical protein
LPVLALLCVPAGAHALTLDARIGLGGVARAGRWTIVRVDVSTAEREALAGDLVVEWGGARVLRDLTLAAGNRKQFELYIRSTDARSTMTVRVSSGGRDIARGEFPVRLVSYDESIAVCVAGPAVSDGSRVSCTAHVEPPDLPGSARGYDAADDVLVTEEQLRAVTEPQRTALTRWRLMQELNRSGVLSETPRLPATVPGAATSPHSNRGIAIGLAAYVCLLAAAGGFFRASSRSMLVYPALLAIAAAGSIAAMSLGHVGQAATVVVRHTSVLQQLGQGHGSVLSMRAVAALPAFDTYELRSGSPDFLFERANGRAITAEQAVDESDRAVLRTRSGAGGRQSFLVEGTTDWQPLRTTRRGRALDLTNVSGADLTDCRLPSGASPGRIAILPSGATVNVELPASPLEHIVTCATAAPPLAFAEGRREVRTEGSTLVVSYLDPAEGD